MKLADWARKQGIAYLTAYRWFKDGKLPVKAYQSDSGTIIVDDDDTSEQPMSNPIGNQSSDIFTHILKKVVEFRNNNATIEDFAGYVLSNFSLKLNTGTDSPRYSKNKPKEEDIQRHFKQFIPKREKPKPNMFVTEEDKLNELVEYDENTFKQSTRDYSINYADMGRHDDSEVFDAKSSTYYAGGTGAGVSATRMNLTPQNYTSSTGFDSRSLPLSSSSEILGKIASVNNVEEVSDIIIMGPTGAFKPTQKEIESAKETFKANSTPQPHNRLRKSLANTADSDESSQPRRRGRKPTKSLGKK